MASQAPVPRHGDITSPWSSVDLLAWWVWAELMSGAKRGQPLHSGTGTREGISKKTPKSRLQVFPSTSGSHSLDVWLREGGPLQNTTLSDPGCWSRAEHSG